MLTMDGPAILYSEDQLPLALRLFALFLGAGLAVMIPTPFLLHADATTPLLSLVLVALFILASVAIGGFFIYMALVSAIDVRIDPVTGRLTRRRRGPFGTRTDSFPLSALATPEAYMRDSEDEGPYPILRLRLPKGRSIYISNFRDLAEAQAWRDRIAAMQA